MSEANSARVAVVTGASSGIGKEAAKALARAGWRVIGIGRNPVRCAQAQAELQACASEANPAVMLCADLALMADTARAADEIAALTDRVDALLNNAGGVTRDRHMTAEGNENTFASNHLGHFLLTARLLPLLRAAAADTGPGAVRVVSVSSTGHEHTDGLDWDDLQSTRQFISGAAYCRAKLANILFTRELAKRLAGDGIVAHAMHPGVVHSNFASHADQQMQDYMATLEGETPEVAADTLVWLASATEPGASTGGYFYLREAIPTSAAGQDDDAARRLWEESEKLVAPWLPG
ncbi:SDR family NAD(P)-dependent oxidoreductase [Mangrovimicrobium sediminis]|uniref:SDR family NAD(P)-dependent oxidoreductase n=1 Tax=Mangrovimicrobium sediminis TaxID=2562682 RepID=A0A4Z0M1D7_9GAMM|nr:SDR family NAD(P)-dependent oxidoreductase [Haliea sp. SAOS-164]TGD73290.1 SDR family NAD(P)-dependent oxidoreductase [Haliea sp. SAOS-164]